MLSVGADTDVTPERIGTHMTLNAAPAPRQTRNSLSSGFNLTAAGPSTGGQARSTAIPVRSYEVAALRADDSLYIGQDKAPAIGFFEQAFSAFARGTLVMTAQGEVAVEDLQPGDMVCTSSGEAAQLIWIGSSSFVPAETGRRMPLVRIMPDSFGQSRPSSFLTVGPAARVLHTPHRLRGEAGGTRLLTPVREFVDGVNVIEVVPPTPVRLFHLCLTRHAVIQANGIEMETFHPGVNATRTVAHSLRDRFLGMFPRISHVTDFGPLAHPRAPEATPELEASDLA